MPDAASCGGKTRPKREAAADTLCDSHDVRRDPGPFMGEQLAGPSHTALHLIEDQQDAMLVAQLAQAPQTLRGHGAQAALALNRLDQNAGGLIGDGGLQRLVIAKGHLIEPAHIGAEALHVFFLPARGDGRQRAAMEGAFERDDAVAGLSPLDQ
jgi:hypothetical protein